MLHYGSSFPSCHPYECVKTCAGLNGRTTMSVTQPKMQWVQGKISCSNLF